MIRPDVTITLACPQEGYGRSVYVEASITFTGRCFAGDAPLDPGDPRLAAAVKDAISNLERAVERWLAEAPRATASGPGDSLGRPCPLCGSMDRQAPSPCMGGFHLPAHRSEGR